jgi:hypothetical protein
MKKHPHFFFSLIRKISRRLMHRRISCVFYENGLFDPDYYTESYPDVKKAGVMPLKHFLDYGALEGRNPSAKFDTIFYFSTNPDVRKSGINPLLHYILFGKSEGRSPLPPKVREDKL